MKKAIVTLLLTVVLVGCQTTQPTPTPPKEGANPPLPIEWYER